MTPKTKKYYYVMKERCSKIAKGIREKGQVIDIETPQACPLTRIELTGKSTQRNVQGYNMFDAYLESQGTVHAIASKTETGVNVYVYEAAGSSDCVETQPVEVVGGETYNVSSYVVIPADYPKDCVVSIKVQEKDENNKPVNDFFLPKIKSTKRIDATFTANVATKKITLKYWPLVEGSVDKEKIVHFSEVMVAKTNQLLPYEVYTGGKKMPTVENPQRIYNTLTSKLIMYVRKNGVLKKKYEFKSNITVNGEQEEMTLCEVGGVRDTFIADCRAKKATYIKRVGRIKSYNGEDVGAEFMSTTGGLDTGATVYYPLKKEVIIDVSNSDIAKGLYSAKMVKEANSLAFFGDKYLTDVLVEYRKRI